MTVAVYTGCRKSEIESLQPADYDAEAGTLRVRGTKTRLSDRVIPCLGPVAAIIARLPRGSPRVVEDWCDVNRDLAKACTKAGVPVVSPNDLRRTFATWLRNNGIDSSLVGRLMGHSSGRVVDAFYAQLSDERMVAAMRTLEDP